MKNQTNSPFSLQSYLRSSRLRTFAFLLLLTSWTTVHSAEMEVDYYWYQNAVKFAGLPLEKLDYFLNPLIGPEKFRLNEKKAPWAGNYFPMQKGGIAHRWQTKQYPQKTPNSEELRKMSSKEIRKLSPVEKYDLLMGYYDFRTTKRELEIRGPQRSLPPEDWEGFCNGVRCAGLITEEPKYPVTVKNRFGLEIQFSPADIKALLGASYFYVQKYAQIGSPSALEKAQSQPNPAVFDLALRFHLAKYKRGFVIDSHLGPEIWNETVVGFVRKLSEPQKLNSQEMNTHPSATTKIRVDLELETLGEIKIKESNHQTKAKVSDGHFLNLLKSSYTLYLDQSGAAIDGVWHNSHKEKGVDFAWFTAGKGADHQYSHNGGNPFLSYRKIMGLARESSHPKCGRLFE